MPSARLHCQYLLEHRIYRARATQLRHCPANLALLGVIFGAFRW